MMEIKKPAVFLDRDGTLIEDTHYPRDPEKVRIIPGVIEALLEIQKKGYLLFVVSNQSGVGRGIITETQFHAVHERLCDLLKSKNIKVEDFAYCFHTPSDGCDCRKPATKLIQKLAESHQIDLGKSYVIGDKWTDVLLAYRVGAQGILLQGGEREPCPHELESCKVMEVSDWKEVKNFILPLHS